MRARDYSPATSSFTTLDPMLAVTGSPTRTPATPPATTPTPPVPCSASTTSSPAASAPSRAKRQRPAQRLPVRREGQVVKHRHRGGLRHRLRRPRRRVPPDLRRRGSRIHYRRPDADRQQPRLQRLQPRRAGQRDSPGAATGASTSSWEAAAASTPPRTPPPSCRSTRSPTCSSARPTPPRSRPTRSAPCARSWTTPVTAVYDTPQLPSSQQRSRKEVL